MKKIMVTQSNYIPWKGYFDAIAFVDEVILLDDVQYTRRDWRNRNLIKTPKGKEWLTIPVATKGNYLQPIQEIQVKDGAWAQKHWLTLSQNYAKAPYFREVVALLEPLYCGVSSSYLSEINFQFLRGICEYLNIDTKMRWSREFVTSEEKSDRLLDICLQAKATEYWSGPSAKNYLRTDIFERAGIKVYFFDYNGYPTYPQLHGDFIHELSIVDLLFQTGRQAKQYFKITATV